MKLPPQSKTVLAHLRAEAHLTSWQAEGVYRIRRLASRIDEIVAAGYDVIKTEAKDTTGQRYIRYSLSGAQKRRATPLFPPRAPRTLLTLERVERVLRKNMDSMCLFESEVQHLIKTLKESA